MNGFGFIEYEDALDARDVVPCKLHLFAEYLHITDLIDSDSFVFSVLTIANLLLTISRRYRSQGRAPYRTIRERAAKQGPTQRT